MAVYLSCFVLPPPRLGAESCALVGSLFQRQPYKRTASDCINVRDAPLARPVPARLITPLTAPANSRCQLALWRRSLGWHTWPCSSTSIPGCCLPVPYPWGLGRVDGRGTKEACLSPRAFWQTDFPPASTARQRIGDKAKQYHHVHRSGGGGWPTRATRGKRQARQVPPSPERE